MSEEKKSEAAAAQMDALRWAEAGKVSPKPDHFESHTPQGQFFMDVAVELQAARRKFPSSLACTVALMEEVGELAKAMLSEDPVRIYQEAKQVAAMAARCALEGDPSLESYRAFHQGVDATPARGRRP